MQAIADLLTHALHTLDKAEHRIVMHVHEEAVAWEHTLHEFYQVYKDWMNEKTYAKDDPMEAAKRGKKPTGWWYTHG